MLLQIPKSQLGILLRQIHRQELHQAVRVLYDGKCPLCNKEIRFLKYVAERREKSIYFVDISLPKYSPAENGGVKYDDAMKQMTVINEQGKVETNVQAFRRMYGAVGLGWVLAMTKIPGISRVFDWAYDWFARNRLRLTGRSECDVDTCIKKSRS